jgi:hypothetical protein
MLILSFIFVRVCDIFEWKQICERFLSLVSICIGVREHIIKRGRDPINSLTPPRFVPVVVFLCSVSSVKIGGDCCVDIGGINYHPCLNFVFVT